MTSDVIARICTGMFVIVFAAGSVYVAVLLLGIGQGPPGPDDYNEGTFWAMQVIWPLALLVSGTCGAVAILRTRGFHASILLLVGLWGVYVVVRYALGVIVAVARDDHALRHPGWPSTCAILLFLLANIGAIYVAWAYLLHTS